RLRPRLVGRTKKLTRSPPSRARRPSAPRRRSPPAAAGEPVKVAAKWGRGTSPVPARENAPAAAHAGNSPRGRKRSKPRSQWRPGPDRSQQAHVGRWGPAALRGPGHARWSGRACALGIAGRRARGLPSGDPVGRPRPSARTVRPPGTLAPRSARGAPRRFPRATLGVGGGGSGRGRRGALGAWA
ncbi:translation initiation factor IF-2-like, partial [Marmota marmota marmota]|uniref:translation initiation factor IF-2-like n=1 Tax=Marmota marmota marmota TaxID=9994 RepID=UPI0020937A34